MANERRDPFIAFRFEIKLDDFAVAGFSECSGLQLETEVQDYAEGGLNTHLRKFPSRTKQTNISLKRGIVDRKVWQWYWDVTQGQITLKNGSIIVYDLSGAKIEMVYEFRDAFPCKWGGPSLNATQSSVALETLELCHEGLERTT